MAKTGYIITVYQDINPSSPTYNQTREERLQDETNCPITPQERWVVVEDETICDGFDKHAVEKKQQSIDGGQTWTDVVPSETRTGSVIEYNSEDCGYVPPTDYSTMYLTFEALENGTFTFTGTSSNSLSYSLDDGQTWTALASGTASPTVTTGNKIMWKGITTPNISNYEGIGQFSSTGRFNTYGNIMSIVYGDNFEGQTTINDYQFYILFNSSKVVNAQNLVLPAIVMKNNCYYSMFSYTSLVAAPVLPATTMAEWCCTSMFEGCTSLVNAPTLPATTLAYYCYSSMFYGCTSLTTAPELPATTLAEGCYENMFCNCTNLNSIKCLATDISANRCTYLWLLYTSSTGTFTKAANMSSWTTGVSGIPSGWTVINE